MLLKKKIPVSYIVNKAKRHFFTVTAISVTVYLIQQQLIYILPSIPVTIPTFLGTAISLILSFNLNQSYERWWEARKVWGSIVNDSRSLIVQLRSFSKGGNQEVLRRITYRQIAWCYCLGQSLRKRDPLENLKEFLSPEDFEEIKRHTNKPLALIEQHSQDLKELKRSGDLEIFHHVQMDNTLVRLCDSMGRAERINTTVFPTTYSFFLHALIYIFITLLSVSLSEIDGLFEIPLLIIISVPFLLLERTAKDMQDPFSGFATDTPVTAIATTIEINLKQLIKDENVPPPFPDNDFYID
jgi:putative membrane protein